MTKFDFYLMMVWITGIWGSEIHWYGFLVSAFYCIAMVIELLSNKNE